MDLAGRDLCLGRGQEPSGVAAVAEAYKRGIYLDCFSGISGNMLLGGLLELGWPKDQLLSLPERLGLSGVSVSICRVKRCGLSGTLVQVLQENPQPQRRLQEVIEIIERADLPQQAGKRARQVFLLLADAEAGVHGVDREQVHFHEVGAADALVDIVGAALGIEYLDVEAVYVSPLPAARGWARSAHGSIPLPAPAVMRLLKGVPLVWEQEPFEYVTPTGAALVRLFAKGFHPPSAMTVEAVGCGAGSRQLPDRPNLLRMFLFRSWQEGPGGEVDFVVELRCVVDDMNPEILAFVSKRLLESGALDVWMVPVQMKKGRPGTELVCLAPPDREQEFSRIIFEESSTIGIRVDRILRKKLKRGHAIVDTPWGPVRAKEIERPGGIWELVPEYEECLKVASANGIPLKEVYRAVEAAAGRKRKGKDQGREG